MISLYDLIERWRASFADAWSGTAADLHEELRHSALIKEEMQRFSVRSVGRALSLLALWGVGSVQKSGANYTIERGEEGGETWDIQLNTLRQENVTPRNQDEIKTLRASRKLPNGVTFYPERFSDCAESKYEERVFYGEPLFNHSKAYYKVCLRVLGKQRAVGNLLVGKSRDFFNRRAAHGKSLPLKDADAKQQAALLADSALFWLWGFCDRPRAKKFNCFKAGMAAPELFPAVEKLRTKLSKEAGTECLSFYQSTRTARNSMNKTVDTSSSEYQNFVFNEPEPTAADLAQYGFTSREQWFAARHDQFGTYDEQKQEAFLDYKNDQRLEQIQRDQGAEGEARLASFERQEHERLLAKRNAKRGKEMEKFRAVVQRKANGLLPYIHGLQKWPRKPVIALTANATVEELSSYTKALKAYEKAEPLFDEKAQNLCNALSALAGDMKTWYGDLKTKDSMRPLTTAVATLKAAIPADLKGEAIERLRAQVAEYEQNVLYTNDKFCVNPLFIYPRPGQQPPYNYFFVPENSDSPPMWQHRTCKGWDANLGKYTYYGPNGEE